jgi:hypothetical protein
MRIWRTRFSSARTTSGSVALGVKAEGQALGQRLRLKHARHLVHTVGKGHGLDGERELAGLNAGNVQRAFNQAQQMLTAALDDVDGLLAVRGHTGIFAHELRVAQDAVQWRAQLVADGADVAALGLVGLLGRVARLLGLQLGLLQCLVSLLVRIDFQHQ